MIYRIQNDSIAISVDTFGAQLKELVSAQGTSFLWNSDPAYWRESSPVLFPFVARLYDGKYTLHGKNYEMGIHGFAKKSEFTLESRNDDSLTFLLTDSDATYTQFPYHFEFRLIYRLDGNTVRISYLVRNMDTETMFFGIGGHPGFRVPLDEGLSFEDYYLEFDEPCTPDHILFSDDVFVTGIREPYPLLGGKRIPLRHDLFEIDALVLTNTAKGVTIRSDKSSKTVHVSFPQMPYVGFWHRPKTDAPFVCVEPWVSLPARKDVTEEFSCKSDLVSLAPGGEYCNDWSITVTG